MEANGRSWSPTDLESVRCCLCARAGVPRFAVPPFAIVRCPSCGLVFTSPRLRPEALRRLYDDSRYFEAGRLDGGAVYGRLDGWSPAMAWQRVWASGRLDLIADAVGGEPARRRLLEVGSAYGLFLAAARDRGFSVTGVEVSRPPWTLPENDRVSRCTTATSRTSRSPAATT